MGASGFLVAIRPGGIGVEDSVRRAGCFGLRGWGFFLELGEVLSVNTPNLFCPRVVVEYHLEEVVVADLGIHHEAVVAQIFDHVLPMRPALVVDELQEPMDVEHHRMARRHLELPHPDVVRKGMPIRIEVQPHTSLDIRVPGRAGLLPAWWGTTEE